MLLLATARWYYSWRCNFTAVLISAGGGDALSGLSSSAVGGSATLSGNTVAVLIGGEMDVRRGRDGNLLLAAVQRYRNMQ